MTRFEWIMGGVLAVLLIVVVFVAGVFWFRPGGNRADATVTAVVAPTSIFAGNTALSAFSAAQAAAKEWQPDAVLLRASATWPQGADVRELLTGATTWSFSFYSPANGATASVTVIEGQPSISASKALNEPLQPAPDSDWQVDSIEAIGLLLAQGGTEFLEANEIAILTAALTTVNPSGRIEWLLSLFGVQSGDSLTTRIDAASGEVLETIDAP